MSTSNKRLKDLILRHKTTPWRGSDKLALAMEILMEANLRQMGLNNAEAMRIIASVANRKVEDLVGEAK